MIKIPALLLACLVTVKIRPVTTAVKQPSGLEGYVFRISGNRMPSPDKTLPPPKGIKTKLYVFELTNLNQVSRENGTPFYSSLGTKLLHTFSSDTSGYFRVLLPPGQYSLFVKKDSLFYANSFDGKNNINPVRVQPHAFTQVRFNIDYDASY
jgi:hypothetical protein